jgi:serine/threonine protein phosphatase PrpC
MQCPACNFEQLAGNRFCEDCGTKLTLVTAPAADETAGRCPHCGAQSSGDFCNQCGLERKSVVEDHLEVSISPALGGVSDVGRQRHRNEDFLALASSAEADVMVVCDGVSHSQQPDRAALAAATCLCGELAGAPKEGDLHAVMKLALRHADDAVRGVSTEASYPGEPPETTVVAAARRGDEIVIGWVGDSRAYWADASQLRQLTVDHSWINEVVASGDMTFEQARNHPNAHGITRTLGGPADGAAQDDPSICKFKVGTDLVAPGWLLLCTDGFWDSHRDPAELASFVTVRIAGHPAGEGAVVLARQLVVEACQKRGHDNTTVALLRVD